MNNCETDGHLIVYADIDTDGTATPDTMPCARCHRILRRIDRNDWKI